MKKPGQVILFQFPQTNMAQGKLRPALLLGKLPGPYDDWLVCMISSQLHQHVKGFDEIVDKNDSDFSRSGLKATSLIRTGRLAVIDGGILLGTLGEVDTERLKRIKVRLSEWFKKV
ncbi:MAG: type II toxin-antitoxin system PemK/MazF family toxin [Anaerolineales bacterium]|nr:type II toxin-antitoxin system PemK/MazF family toxin [Anaerolineales bacterium]